MSIPDSNEGASQVQPRICDRFSAGDADVKFSSSDNVIFHIHRKNLEIAAAAFPSAEFDTRGEVVPLTEDAATLEFLFQYVYPQRHPHLEETSFETLAPLAEAAEKYEVFSAMTLCYIRMKNVLPNHSAEIFNYASRHGYNDILGLAAPHMLDIPLDEIVKTLSPHLIVPWVCYREAWSRAAFKVLMEQHREKEETVHCPRCQRYHDIELSDFHNLALNWVSLGEKRSRATLQGLLVKEGSFGAGILRATLEESLNTVPSFDTFL